MNKILDLQQAVIAALATDRPATRRGGTPWIREGHGE